MLHNLIRSLLAIGYPLARPFLSFQLYAYLAVGAANTLLNIGLFAVLYQVVIPQASFTVGGFSVASYTIALVIAFMVTVPTGYWLAKSFAFNQGNVPTESDGRKLGKYMLVVLQGLISDYLLMKALIVFLSVQPTAAKLISTAVVLVMNYLLQKYFTFRVKRVG